MDEGKNHYFIATGYGKRLMEVCQDLEKEVGSWIERGYVPVGSPLLTNEEHRGMLRPILLQALFLPKETEEKEAEKRGEEEGEWKKGEPVRWGKLRDLPAGMVFVTTDAVLAVKTARREGFGERSVCVGLADGEFVSFTDGDDTLVRAVLLNP